MVRAGRNRDPAAQKVPVEQKVLADLWVRVAQKDPAVLKDLAALSGTRVTVELPAFVEPLVLAVQSQDPAEQRDLAAPLETRGLVELRDRAAVSATQASVVLRATRVPAGLRVLAVPWRGRVVQRVRAEPKVLVVPWATRVSVARWETPDSADPWETPGTAGALASAGP